MELTAGHGLQGLMLIATVAGGYAVVKNQLSRVIEDLEKHIEHFEDHRSKFDTRLDGAESERSNHTIQIETLKSINSPQELKDFNREMGEFSARLKATERQIEKLDNLHNGRHPPVPSE